MTHTSGQTEFSSPGATPAHGEPAQTQTPEKLSPDAAPDPARRANRFGLVVLAGMSLMFGVVLARVAQLQLFPGERLREHVQDRVSRKPQMGARGDVLDRRGRVLATTRVGYRVFVDPSELQEPLGAAFLAIEGVTGVPQEEIAERVVPRMAESAQRVQEGKKPLRYVSIGGVLPDLKVEEARGLKLKGVHLERRQVRESIAGGVIDSIVGFVGIDHDGLLGAELAHDERMQPEPGYMDYVRDAQGRPLWVEVGGFQPPQRGGDLRLSFDLAIQQIAHDEIVRGVEECDAAGGRCVVVDPTTGEILAMVDHIRNRPGLAPFDPVRDRHADEWTRFVTIRDDPKRAAHPALGRNRCVEDLYEPGSTFKCFFWATVTERGLAKPEEIIDVHGGRWNTDYGRYLEDVTKRDLMSWREVLIYSSNIGMAQVTRRLTDEQMRGDLLRFGFGAKTGVGLSGESPGLVTSARDWSKYTQTSTAMGYEVGVTPLQMVRGFSVFARNGDLAGTLPVLRLLATEPGESGAHVRKRVLPDWVAYLTRETMASVGENMSRRALRDSDDHTEFPWGIFGKSGTAKIARPGAPGYFQNQYNTSFIAGSPVDSPRLVVLVVIDDPGPERVRTRTHYGSATAGPVLLRVMERSLEYLGVPPMRAPEDEDQEVVVAH